MERCLECGLPLPRDRCPVPGCQDTLPKPQARPKIVPPDISQAQQFHVFRTLGGGRHEDFGIHNSLARARGVKRRAGRDKYGRQAMIYAIFSNWASVLVE